VDRLASTKGPVQPKSGRIRRRALQIGLRLIGPALLVLALARIKDPERILGVLARAAWLPLCFVVALHAFNIHLKVVRFQWLLKAHGHHYSLRRAWSSLLSCMYVGMLTPGRVGDILRVQYLRHDLGMAYSEALAFAAMDRFCDIYVILGFCAFGIARFAALLTGQLAYATWITVALCALAPAVLLVPGLADRILVSLFARFSRTREPVGLRAFLSTLRALVGRPLFVALPLTAAAFMGFYTQGWLVAKSLGLPLSLFDAMCFMSMTGLLSQVPISISGLGVREIFLALVFPTLGMTSTEGVAFGLMEFAAIHLTQVVAGFVSWQYAPPPILSEEPKETPAASSS
jgi:glycosyltransferase 2 family protein